jgi:hypothetical protein
MSATGAEAERIEFEYQASCLPKWVGKLVSLAGDPKATVEQVDMAFENIATNLAWARDHAEKAGLCTPAAPPIPPAPGLPYVALNEAGAVVEAGSVAADRVGPWANPDSDPLADVRAARDAVYQGAGQENMTDLWVTPGQLRARGVTFTEACDQAEKLGYKLKLTGATSETGEGR